MSLQTAQSKSLIKFHSAIDAYATKRDYMLWLDRFVKFTGRRDYDQLLEGSQAEIQNKLEEFTLYLSPVVQLPNGGQYRDGYPASTVRMALNALFLFYAMNDVTVNTIKIKKMFPKEGEIPIGGQPYTKDDIRKIIAAAKTFKRNRLRNIAMIHFLAATGCRLGVFDELKIKHLTLIEDSYAVVVHAKSKYEYYTFLHRDAREALDKYLDSRPEGKDPESAIFEFEARKNNDEFSGYFFRSNAARMSIARLVKRAGIVFKPTWEIKDQRGNVIREVHSVRFNKPTAHAFRKYFATQLTDQNKVNQTYIEIMLGHGGERPLDKHYKKPSMEMLFAEYQKGVNALRF